MVFCPFIFRKICSFCTLYFEKVAILASSIGTRGVFSAAWTFSKVRG